MISFIRYFSIFTLITFSCCLKASEAEKNAWKAAHAMQKCFKRCGLTKHDLYKMALFIEQELPKKVVDKGTYYFSRIKTKLARSIEVDPESNKVFIHLQTHNIGELGHGARKSVTYSILYSTTNPEKVAHSHTIFPNKNEAQAMADLRDLPGLCKVISVLDDSRNPSSDCYSFITKYYPRGDFAHFLRKNKKSLSFQDRLRFCRDIIIGIESMHSKGYAHRDLGLKNFFMERRGNKLHLVVADFGRAVKGGHTNEKGAQGGYSLCAPEGLDPEKLKGDDYLRTDIFALGCVFYKILYQKKPCWMHPKRLKNQQISVHKRQIRFKRTIERFRSKRAKQLKSACKGSKKRFSPGKVEQIILQMIHPTPSCRPTASDVRASLL